MNSNPLPAPGAPQTGRRKRRLAWLCGIGAALVLGTAFYVYFWQTRAIGSGPAGPAVASEKFDFHWTDREVLLVGLGDSVTAGFGASPKMGYFDRLFKNPADEFPDMKDKSLSDVFPNLTAQNLALSGTTSQECLDVLIPKLKTQDEETFGIVVLTTGGNDIIHNYGRTPPREGAMYGATLEEARPWIENFRVRLDAILDGIDAKFPGGCFIFMANIFDPTDEVGDAMNAGLPSWPEGLKLIAAYNEIIAQAAQKRKNVEMIDMHRGFLGHGIHCKQFWRKSYDKKDPFYWYADNLEDPNDRGYDALRRMFLNEMARVLPSFLEDGD